MPRTAHRQELEGLLHSSRPAAPILALLSALGMVGAALVAPSTEPEPDLHGSLSGALARPSVSAPPAAARGARYDLGPSLVPVPENEPELGWWKVNPHSHVLPVGAMLVRDDGKVPLSYWIDRYSGLGFDMLWVTPHSSKNKGAVGESRWARTEEVIVGTSDEIVLALGEEVNIKHGPGYRLWRVSEYIGRIKSPLNHVVVLGASRFVPNGVTLGECSRIAHESGGLTILAHPRIWDQDGWSSREDLDTLDGFEVYNGIVFDRLAADNAAEYRRAISYDGLGLKMAAVGSSDTHRKEHLSETATWFAGEAPEPAGFLGAIRARTTFATDAFDDIRVTVDKVGEVRSETTVELSISLDRKVEWIVLWRNQEVAGHWDAADAALFTEEIESATVYSWEIRDGASRGHSSGIWYEPVRAATIPVRGDSDG